MIKVSKTREPLQLGSHLVLGTLAFFSLFPIYFVLVNCFKSYQQFVQNVLSFPTQLDLVNFATAWQVMAGPLLNTTLIALVSVTGTLVFGSLASYAFSHLKFPGQSVLFGSVLALLLIPAFLTLIPLYLEIKSFGLGGNLWGVILPYMASGQAFAILICTSFFRNLPGELFEAAKIDGASDLGIFLRIVLPLSLPVLATVTIISFLPIWNDLLLPQLILSRETQTVTMALVGFQGSAQSGTSTNFGALMAGYVISSLPLVLLFTLLMRYYVAGITSGAVKG